jgi:hypothetical protein
MLAIGALLTVVGPYFPPALGHVPARADSRRCMLGPQTEQSDCALVGAQWVLTSARTVATARPVRGHLHVRIGAEEYAVDQVVFQPHSNGGANHDVTLLKLVNRVPSFPVLPLPGEFPVSVEQIAQRALSERAWIVATIGPSPLWDDRSATTLASKPPTILTRVRSLVATWTGRTSND